MFQSEIDFDIDLMSHQWDWMTSAANEIFCGGAAGPLRMRRRSLPPCRR